MLRIAGLDSALTTEDMLCLSNDLMWKTWNDWQALDKVTRSEKSEGLIEKFRVRFEDSLRECFRRSHENDLFICGLMVADARKGVSR